MATAVGVHAPAFKRVVVPLDGSRVAEEILPHLLRMRDGLGEMILLQVVPGITLPAIRAMELQAELAEKAEQYLMRLYDQIPHSRIRLRVETGFPSERILAVCQELEADLLVMTTHAKNGLGSILFGGTARTLLESLRIPIFLVKPGLPKPARTIDRILVPIGTEAGEERLLEPLARLATGLHSELTLLRAIPTIMSQDPLTGLVLPLPGVGRSPEEVPPSLERLSQAHPGVVTQVLTVRGDIAPTILDQADRIHADLVAMTTHAREGFRRLLSGSFAEDVLRGARTPVLLQHVTQPGSGN